MQPAPSLAAIGPRIFVAGPLACGQELTLPAAATRHIQVLRLQPGAQVRLFNGLGLAFCSTILAMQRHAVSVRIDASENVASDGELPFAVHLYVGMPANERMDWLVEKATELGVTSITPLHCARSVLRLQGERAQRRVAHWQNIARAACAQSGRLWLPLIHSPCPLEEVLEKLASKELMPGELRPRPSSPWCWVLSPNAALTLATWRQELALSLAAAPSPPKPALHFLCGPEGGFDPGEMQNIAQHVMNSLNLGPRILRAETAPITILALLQDI